jgi:hypothetical protein
VRLWHVIGQRPDERKIHPESLTHEFGSRRRAFSQLQECQGEGGSDFSLKLQKGAQPQGDAPKFMLMMHAPGEGDYQISGWTPDDFKAHIAMHRFNKAYRRQRIRRRRGLAPPGQANRCAQARTACR